MAICHGFYVLAEYRGKGMGHKLMVTMIDALAQANYDYAICTTAGDNAAMQAVLRKSGWERLSLFENRKTGLPHQVWGRKINV